MPPVRPRVPSCPGPPAVAALPAGPASAVSSTTSGPSIPVRISRSSPSLPSEPSAPSAPSSGPEPVSTENGVGRMPMSKLSGPGTTFSGAGPFLTSRWQTSEKTLPRTMRDAPGSMTRTPTLTMTYSSSTSSTPQSSPLTLTSQTSPAASVLCATEMAHTRTGRWRASPFPSDSVGSASANVKASPRSCMPCPSRCRLRIASKKVAPLRFRSSGVARERTRRPSSIVGSLR